MKYVGWIFAAGAALVAVYFFSKRGGGGGQAAFKPDPGFSPPSLPNTGTGGRFQSVFDGFSRLPIFQTRADTDRVPGLIRASADGFASLLGALQPLLAKKSATAPDSYFLASKDFKQDFGTTGNFEHTTD